jgi:starvation-inducible outer membrane lipoprotein
MPKIPWLLLGLFAALAGCGPAISPAIQHEAGPQVGFAELAAHPDRYQGQTGILGGKVVQVQSLGPGSLLSVDQHDLDSQLFPSGAASGGTFLVESDEQLSPSKYQPGSIVTVAGVVAGQKNSLLLLKSRQIHYWEGPVWEKWNHPVPPEWYDYNPQMEYWYTPSYFSPWAGPGGRR